MGNSYSFQFNDHGQLTYQNKTTKQLQPNLANSLKKTNFTQEQLQNAFKLCFNHENISDIKDDLLRTFILANRSKNTHMFDTENSDFIEISKNIPEKSRKLHSEEIQKLYDNEDLYTLQEDFIQTKDLENITYNCTSKQNNNIYHPDLDCNDLDKEYAQIIQNIRNNIDITNIEQEQTINEVNELLDNLQNDRSELLDNTQNKQNEISNNEILNNETGNTTENRFWDSQKELLPPSDTYIENELYNVNVPIIESEWNPKELANLKQKRNKTVKVKNTS